jgi:hypothetical protein
MDFDERQLRAFLAIADTGSLGRAARVVNLTQPSLSRLVQTMEARLGHRLFERGGKGMALTARLQKDLGISAAAAAAISGNQAWQPDGRAVSPLLVDGTEARTALLSIFNGTPPADGQWTLFAADLSAGSQMEVVAWGLTITTIPEPTTVSLSLAACALLMRRRRPAALGTSHR